MVISLPRRLAVLACTLLAALALTVVRSSPASAEECVVYGYEVGSTGNYETHSTTETPVGTVDHCEDITGINSLCYGNQLQSDGDFWVGVLVCVPLIW